MGTENTKQRNLECANYYRFEEWYRQQLAVSQISQNASF